MSGQVSVGAVDDGIMSSQLLAQLYGEENPAVTVSERKEPNVAISPSKVRISNVFEGETENLMD